MMFYEPIVVVDFIGSHFGFNLLFYWMVLGKKILNSHSESVCNCFFSFGNRVFLLFSLQLNKTLRGVNIEYSKGKSIIQIQGQRSNK